jgi:hypothetical protein
VQTFVKSRKSQKAVDQYCPIRIVRPHITERRFRDAPLAELVDAPDSKSGSERSAGSIPAGGTTNFIDIANHNDESSSLHICCNPGCICCFVDIVCLDEANVGIGNAVLFLDKLAR